MLGIIPYRSQTDPISVHLHHCRDFEREPEHTCNKLFHQVLVRVAIESNTRVQCTFSGAWNAKDSTIFTIQLAGAHNVRVVDPFIQALGVSPMEWTPMVQSKYRLTEPLRRPVKLFEDRHLCFRLEVSVSPCIQDSVLNILNTEFDQHCLNKDWAPDCTVKLLPSKGDKSKGKSVFMFPLGMLSRHEAKEIIGNRLGRGYYRVDSGQEGPAYINFKKNFLTEETRVKVRRYVNTAKRAAAAAKEAVFIPTAEQPFKPQKTRTMTAWTVNI